MYYSGSTYLSYAGVCINIRCGRRTEATSGVGRKRKARQRRPQARNDLFVEYRIDWGHVRFSSDFAAKCRDWSCRQDSNFAQIRLGRKSHQGHDSERQLVRRPQDN